MRSALNSLTKTQASASNKKKCYVDILFLTLIHLIKITPETFNKVSAAQVSLTRRTNRLLSLTLDRF